MNSVSLTQVNKRFINGVQALHNVSVDFEAGSFNAIIGPSGAPIFNVEVQQLLASK